MTETTTEAMTEAALFELLSLECRVDEHGNVRYYNAQGQLHRVYGPAIVSANGFCAWWQNGLLHRVDGPAVIYSDGHCAWHINGNALTETEWQQAVASMAHV